MIVTNVSRNNECPKMEIFITGINSSKDINSNTLVLKYQATDAITEMRSRVAKEFSQNESGTND